MQHKSPCLICTRVKDPQKCENKSCRDWQAWFIDRWETMRDAVRADMHAAQLQTDGVLLGGNYYSTPHRIKSYLASDPCHRCPCNPCTTPCPVHITWAEKKGA